MRCLVLEPVGGCSGDMSLAALIDLGASVEAIEAGLARLDLEGWRLEVRRASKFGIHGTRVDVHVDHGDHAHDHANDHDHHHHHHGHGHGHGHHDHRSWGQIRALIEAAELPADATRMALAIFERIALAEAHVHGTTPEEVHFHEVGAVDSIVDIVGVALALDDLGVEKIYALPPPLGSGIVQSQHGPIPVPAPATLEILRGRAVRPSGPGERTTPTGAAILAALAEEGLPPSFVPERIGYGVGHADFEDAANVLRATLARESPRDAELLQIECNLDDASPQLLARAIERCLEAGALDAWVAPLTMKKGRPGHLLAVLAPASKKDELVQLLFRETPTLGLRHHPVSRDELDRRFVQVETRFGPIPIKLGSLGDRLLNAAPEWDDCVAAADRHGVSARQVRDEALAIWHQRDPSSPIRR